MPKKATTGSTTQSVRSRDSEELREPGFVEIERDIAAASHTFQRRRYQCNKACDFINSRNALRISLRKTWSPKSNDYFGPQAATRIEVLNVNTLNAIIFG